eukprot:gnl/TRDRNA2_/TRDRNA2_201791_c0_seq1.p1 gnl/TRDRNA2_/TRDRNA2_201791_c0~~gnl/TRDRNA2_/TRDRNA2_201791_c0_seq1.p1  ORF type:complete len:373 (+),score=25.11 gnl/TRDRNA2_/TRDRNA2_201791_c0_seq1:61-1179(+)
MSTAALVATKMSPPAALLSVLHRLAGQAPRMHVIGRRASLRLTAVVAVAGLALGELKSERRCARLTSSHPLFTWMVENVCIIGTAFVAFAMNSSGSVMSAYLSTLFQVWTSLAIQGVLTNVVYSHIPYFSGGARPKQSLGLLIRDYVRTNWLVDAVSTSLKFFIPKMLSRRLVPTSEKFSPLAFIAKLAVMRVSVDIGFWLGHRALHHRSLYWMHRRHHEHHKPVLATNYHFHPVDLFIEAGFPILLGYTHLLLLGCPSSMLELHLFAGYIGWHEVGSHCGKPVPTISYFPPLAPLYQLILGDVDRNNVQHHDIHHARLNCNYSIVIWPDVVMGTRCSNRKPAPPDLARYGSGGPDAKAACGPKNRDHKAKP